MKASPIFISLQKHNPLNIRASERHFSWNLYGHLCRVTPHPCCNYTTVCIDRHFGNIWNCSKHIKPKFSKQKTQQERNDLLVPEQECCYSLLFLNVGYYSTPYGSGHACLSSTLKLLSCSKRWFQLMTPPPPPSPYISLLHNTFCRFMLCPYSLSQRAQYICKLVHTLGCTG